MFSPLSRWLYAGQTEQLVPSAIRRETRRTWFAVIVVSIAMTAVHIFTYGSIFTSIALLGIVAVTFITFYNLEWAFLVFVGMVLMFDQFPPAGYGASIVGTEYFGNLKAFPFLANVPLAAVNPLELHLLLLFAVWILHIATRKKVVLQGIPVWFTATIFFLWLIISTIYGLRRGGDFLAALWELRALFYLGLMYFFVPQIVQRREHVQQLVWVVIAAVSFKSLLAIIRIIRLGFDLDGRTDITTHEDPLFIVSLFTLLIGLMVFRCNIRQRTFLFWIIPSLLYVFILAQRRATWGAFAVAIIALLVLLKKTERWMLLRIILPLCGVAVVYLALFWNSESAIGNTAQLVKSAFSSTKEDAGDRYYSNLYRTLENYNLAQTVQSSPFVGIGFGNKYSQPIALALISFPLREYIPHNEIFWLVVKMGSVGFFLFWLFFDAFIFQAASIFSRLGDPYLKSVALVIIAAILGQIFVSYYDLQLTFYRNMVYLGTMMGLIPTLEHIQTASDKLLLAKSLQS